MIVKVLFSGAGGQGVLTMGNVLANAAMLENFFVTYLPAYGAAMRGGTANCTVSISDVEIASPVASSPDMVVAMNHPSALNFMNRLQPGGQLFYNASLINNLPYRGDIEVSSLPANDLARSLKNERSANMVMLGYFVKTAKIIKLKTIMKSLEVLMESKPKLVEASQKAVNLGYKYKD
jgi:2-oxoglutarate ferredoxin oxidoreductase subunit gamma